MKIGLSVRAIGSVLVDEVHHVGREERHVAGHREAEMVQLVRLVPDQHIWVELRLEPLVIRHSGELVLLSDEEGSRHVELVDRDGRWLDLAILVHVFDGTVVIASPSALSQHALHVEDQVLVAVAGRVVLHQHVPSVHIVDVVVAPSELMYKVEAKVLQLVAQ